MIRVAEVEACGCQWDDSGSPIWMCLQHCPPADPVINDEYQHPVYGRVESEGNSNE